MADPIRVTVSFPQIAIQKVTVSEGMASSVPLLSVTNILYIGTHARLVKLATGLALEIKNSAGDWIQQTQWTEA